jgi:hypothetical protein
LLRLRRKYERLRERRLDHLDSSKPSDDSDEHVLRHAQSKLNLLQRHRLIGCHPGYAMAGPSDRGQASLGSLAGVVPKVGIATKACTSYERGRE